MARGSTASALLTAPGLEKNVAACLDERPAAMIIDLTDTERRTVELSWRIAVPLPKKTERLGTIRVTNGTELPAGFYPGLRGRIDQHRHEKETRP